MSEAGNGRQAPLKVGTRVRCDMCGAEAIVTKEGEQQHDLACHDTPITLTSATPET